MAKLRHASVFSGIGGAELAATWMGWDNIFHCEINPFARRILDYWFPQSKSYDDITKTDFTEWRGRVDVLTGGFPCQPFSVAGKRKGEDDDRYLWPHMLRAIGEVQPSWVVAENVAGISTMVQSKGITKLGRTDHLFEESYIYREEFDFTLDTICDGLESAGYEVQPIVIPACAVGAPHRRDRIWIVAHRSDAGAQEVQQEGKDGVLPHKVAADTDSHRQGERTDEQVSIARGEGKAHDSHGGENGTPPHTERSGGNQVHPQAQPEQPDGERSHGNGCEWNGSFARGEYPDRGFDRFPTTQPTVCGGDDGLPFNVDNLAIPKGKWRAESIKAYGNAWVPQVAYEIFKAIQQSFNNKMKGLTSMEYNNIGGKFYTLGVHSFTFIDLFAGIGGFRMALQNLGGKCVFSSEVDEQAKKTYFANYGEVPYGDITKEETKAKIPKDFDVLCAGFPCQSFSLAGKRRGFADETRGTLFFEVADILRRFKPKAFFLENVKGLVSHDKGRTFKTILETLDEVGYVVPEPRIVNAMYFGVPQHRERIYIVGFRKDLGIDMGEFSYPEQKEVKKRWIDVREKEPVPAKYYLSTAYMDTLIRHKARHQAKGHGFGYDIIPDDGIAHAIVVGGMGRESNLVIDFRQKDLTPTTRIKGVVNKQGWRRMTPREWARLQGYPDDFKIVVSDSSAYKQFGNSVAVPAIQATASQLIKVLREHGVLSAHGKGGPDMTI